MPNTDGGDIIRATVNMEMFSERYMNVYHIMLDGSGTIDDATVSADIADWLDTAYANLTPHQSDELLYEEIGLYNVTQDRPMQPVLFPVITTGALATPILPPQCAMLGRFFTDTKLSQGRKYIPGFVASGCTLDGGPLAAILNAMVDFVTDVLLNPTTDVGEIFAGNWRPLVTLFIEWTGAIIDQHFRTQRRRVQGVGT